MNNLNKIIFFLVVILFSYSFMAPIQSSMELSVDVSKIDSSRIISLANKFLNDSPVTITSFKADRSSGGIHDFYSEGDYWWPDPKNPDGPYIRKDGMTNPENFVLHRKALIDFSIKVSALATAYKINKNKKYADAALKHLKAWFVEEETKMNSNLLYAQAIKGVVTGRGIGIIDTIHLVEVAQAIIVLEKMNYFNEYDLSAIKNWFQNYLDWLTVHKYGIDERDNGNNHSTCWTMQVAEFAKLVGDSKETEFCNKFYKETLLPNQMADDGSFPLELKRTKPYGYSIFNLDAMTMVCRILSNEKENLFEYKTSDGKSINKGMEFLYPYLADKSKWPYQKDVMYFDQWPVRQPSLLFCGIAFDNSKYISLWKALNPDPAEEEIIRNFPIRQPVLWIN